jgi:hypothetical protein
MDDIGLIGIFYFSKSVNDGGGGGPEEDYPSERRLGYLGGPRNPGTFFVQLYSRNLVALKYGNNICNDYFDLCIEFQEDIFFKAVYLKKQFILFSYITGGILLFETYKFNYNFGFYNVYSNYYGPIYADFLDFLNDFIKINDRRIIFIYTSPYSNINFPQNFQGSKRNLETPNFLVNILIIDIDQSYRLNIHAYKVINYWEEYLPIMQISGCLYNDFLLLSTTYENFNDYLNGNNNYFSSFMIFGYPNGTDGSIDISHFLNDIENNQNIGISFFRLLYENFTIENNIFEYERENMI